jgi:uncharacterized damage-inducible protein DinB
MKEYFLKLYQYNAWANVRVFGALTQQKVEHEKIYSLMSHIVVAQFLWLHRIKGLAPPPYELWQRYAADELMAMAEEAGKMWLSFIEEENNFNRELTYTNFVGLPYTNNVEQIMIHLVNHSTYHRGQVALLLRQLGYDPINTDFITYDRILRGQLKE